MLFYAILFVCCLLPPNPLSLFLSLSYLLSYFLSLSFSRPKPANILSDNLRQLLWEKRRQHPRSNFQSRGKSTHCMHTQGHIMKSRKRQLLSSRPGRSFKPGRMGQTQLPPSPPDCVKGSPFVEEGCRRKIRYNDGIPMLIYARFVASAIAQ